MFDIRNSGEDPNNLRFFNVESHRLLAPRIRQTTVNYSKCMPTRSTSDPPPLVSDTPEINVSNVFLFSFSEMKYLDLCWAFVICVELYVALGHSLRKPIHHHCSASRKDDGHNAQTY